MKWKIFKHGTWLAYLDGTGQVRGFETFDEALRYVVSSLF